MTIRVAWFFGLSLAASPALAQFTTDWSRMLGSASGDNVVIGCAVQSTGHTVVSFAGPDPANPFSTEIRLARFASSGAPDFDVPVASAPTAHFSAHLADSQDNTYLIGEAGPGVDLAGTLIKLDASGAVAWQRSFGQPGSWNQSIGALASDGSVIVATTVNFNDKTDVRRYSPAGALLWSQLVAVSPFAEQWNDMLVLPDDSFVVVGQTFASVATIARFSSSGFLLWARDFPSPGGTDDEFRAVATLGDGRIVACGNRGIGTSTDPLALVGVYSASNGTLLDLYTYNGPSAGPDDLVDATRASDGAVWCVGTSFDALQGQNVLALHWPSATGSSAGTVQVASWDAAGFDDEGFSVVAGDAGQVWVAGRTAGSANASDRDGIVLEFDESMVVAWQVASNGLGFDDDFAKIAHGADRSLTVAGYTKPNPNTQVSLARIDLNDAPHAACASQTNSLGCVPQMVYSGLPSASATSGFVVTVSMVMNARPGLFIYGNAGAQTPFGSGFVCVASPSRRTPVVDTGGNPPGAGANSCTGRLSLDFNAFAAGVLGGSPSALLSTPGATVYCQGWSRDPLASSTINLSNSLVYTVLP